MRATRMRASRLIAAGAVAALMIGAAGCAESDRDGGDEGSTASGGTFIFAGAGRCRWGATSRSWRRSSPCS